MGGIGPSSRGKRVAIIMLAASLGWAGINGLWGHAVAQPLTAEEVVRALARDKPPPNRSLSVEPTALDDQFLDSLPNRGLRVEERQKLDAVVAAKQLPSIDVQVLFALDSATLTAQSRASLEPIGTALRSPSLHSARIAINGHTDASGEPAYNQRLSELRASSVREYLIERFGIDRARLVVAGYGEERLKNPADPTGQENRRVELVNLSGG